jgi:branched-chain amino acid transport system ATP-binding protein
LEVKPVLKLENLSVHYGAIEALKNLSLEVHQGEIVSLIGANGAGKTTALRTISGLEKKTSGNIIFLGEDLSKISSSNIVRKGISHIPEGRRVFPKMSVEENLDLGAITRCDKDGIQKDMDKVYELFPKLRERKHQMAGTLSGGEQQMLAIARGLLSKPQLLILDEPSMGLAPIIVQEIFEIIKSINEEGTTILLVEQNANLALKISKRSYIIKTGSIEMEGTSKELIAMDEIRKAYLGG